MKAIYTSLLAAVAAFSAAAYDATSYVQDGLVANWDGITHDPAEKDANSVMYWKDLVGGYSFKLTNRVFVVDRGFYFDPKTNYKTWGELSSADTATLFGSRKDYTLEVVACLPQKGSNQQYIFRSGNIALGPRNQQNPSPENETTTWFTLAGHGYYAKPLCLSDTEYVNKTNTFAATYTNVYVKGAALNGTPRGLVADGPEIALASMHSGTAIGANSGGSYSMKQTIFAIRVYNRVLTDAEIAHNAAIDDTRFRDIPSATRLVAGTLDGEPANIGTPEPNYGANAATIGSLDSYSIAGSMLDYGDGVHAFSIGDGRRAFYRDATVSENGTVSTETDETFSRTVVAGQTTVTWNFTNRQMRAAFSPSDTRRGTVSVDERWVDEGGDIVVTAAPKYGYRFSRWEGDIAGVDDPLSPTITLAMSAPRTLRAVFDRSVESYVQDGLVANWDGIAKSIAPGTYNDTNLVWRDCVGSYGINMTNALATARSFYLCKSDGKIRVGWADHTELYKFLLKPDSTAYATDYSVEVIATLCNGGNNKVALKAPVSWTSSINTFYGFGLAFFLDSPAVDVCTATWTDNQKLYRLSADGNVNNITNIYTIVYTNRCRKALYVNGVEAVFADDAKTGDIRNQDVNMYIGCNGFNSEKNTISSSMEGYFHALRFYNRPLTAREAGMNALVDKIRFFGQNPVTCTVEGTLDGVRTTLGSPSPAYGIAEVTEGDTQTFTLANCISNYMDGVHGVIIGDGERLCYKDVTVRTDGAEPTVKTGESFDHTYAGTDTRVIWNFTNRQVSATLSVNASSMGTAPAGEFWIKKDQPLTLKAVPAAGYRFLQWTGDVDGIAETTNETVTVTMSAPRAIRAVFAVAPYAAEVYPKGYALVTSDYPAAPAPSVGSGATGSLEARYRTFGTLGVGPFDADRRPGFILQVK